MKQLWNKIQSFLCRLGIHKLDSYIENDVMHVFCNKCDFYYETHKPNWLERGL